MKLGACLSALLLTSLAASAADTRNLPLDSIEGLELRNVTAEVVTYKGRQAVRVTRGPDGRGIGMFLVVKDLEFHNGTIEVDMAGEPAPGATGGARGFVGLGLRMPADYSRFEHVYLRPTNGRAEDQERRNHSVQYSSEPGYGWMRLRSETPGKYETYADLVPGEWAHVKLDVRGEKLRVHVNGAEQPTLVVNDMKMGADASGRVGLWINGSTVAHFSNLKITKE